MSLRWRLILWQMGFLAIVLTAFSFISYRFLADGLAAETDNTLRERAEHVLEAVQMVPNRSIEAVSASTDEFASPGVYVQVLTPDGQVVAHSDNLGRQRLPIPPSLLEQVLAGQSFYTTETVETLHIRLYHRPILRDEGVVGVVQVGQSLHGLEAALRRLQTIYLVGIIGALTLGGLVSWFLLRLGLRPVTLMAQTTDRIAQSGDMKARLPYRGAQDEIGRLAGAFNLMMDRLEAAFDIQRRFVADTAHELRTPLSTILGNVDLLLRYGQDPQRREPALAAIKREGERTSRLAASLLLLAQADAGQKLELRPVELDEVLIEVYEQAQELTNSVSVLLKYCEAAPVLGDPDRLKQVLLNLIDNALKHTDPPGRVTLSLTCQASMAQMTVADSGCGIPAADLPHIFERFYRGRNGRSSTGLGLSIVKWIVEEHHGEITVASEPGQGASFTIRLPIRANGESSCADDSNII
jgi:signal transduction histidine kinase